MKLKEIEKVRSSKKKKINFQVSCQFDISLFLEKQIINISKFNLTKDKETISVCFNFPGQLPQNNVCVSVCYIFIYPETLTDGKNDTQNFLQYM